MRDSTSENHFKFHFLDPDRLDYMKYNNTSNNQNLMLSPGSLNTPH